MKPEQNKGGFIRAYQLLYERINWENEDVSKATPVSAANLNKIDYAVFEHDKRIVELDTKKAEQATVLNMVSDWSIDETTGIITITKLNGEQILFDLNIEKIPISFSLSESGILTMTTDDGSKFTADIASMIPVLTFENSETIDVTVSGTGKNKTYSFAVKDGSITGEKLQPNYLANVTVQAQAASESAASASLSATTAQLQAERAKEYADQASGGSTEQIIEQISTEFGLTKTNYNGTSAKATSDASGNNIESTYATKTELTAQIGDIGSVLDAINRTGV